MQTAEKAMGSIKQIGDTVIASTRKQWSNYTGWYGARKTLEVLRPGDELFIQKNGRRYRARVLVLVETSTGYACGFSTREIVPQHAIKGCLMAARRWYMFKYLVQIIEK